MSGHVSSIKLYVGIFLTLMALTTITIVVAYINVGPWNKIVALGIASFKATLVVLYFMHVRYSARLIWVILASALFWMGILFALTFSDYWTRGWLS